VSTISPSKISVPIVIISAEGILDFQSMFLDLRLVSGQYFTVKCGVERLAVPCCAGKPADSKAGDKTVSVSSTKTETVDD
jgi:hypothetical protein